MPSPCTDKADKPSLPCALRATNPRWKRYLACGRERQAIDPRRIGYDCSATWTPLDSLAKRYSCPPEDVQL